MSNQGENGWFPECLICGRGNIGGAVCLDPTCHERHNGAIIESACEKYVQKEGHWWQHCHCCDTPILSDGGSFGVYALCIDCWNVHARAGRLPPSSPLTLHENLASGVLRVAWVRRGLVSVPEVTVSPADRR